MIKKETVKWEQAKYDNDVARYLYDRLNIGYHVCILLAQKGITSQLEAEKFLWPRLMYLDDPSHKKDERLGSVQHDLRHQRSVWRCRWCLGHAEGKPERQRSHLVNYRKRSSILLSL